jgi:hypothetical protein
MSHTTEELVKWALGRRVKSHLGADGRVDPDRCDCGKCVLAQEAADRLRDR